MPLIKITNDLPAIILRRELIAVAAQSPGDAGSARTLNDNLSSFYVLV
jgi:hypothetical protein